ncbi:CPBP family glutamic-type intramembrane protease [Novosphingobium guangzhouense]|uniref:CAAX protease n=1 Tax=Novosphingobium guangzhouense TaxID=1850347 RepID=A0A2K2FZK4_9SPHN|nr:CPBP family glutamic-type intramembrane protease [Novosphingobium guangzhouense]PNU04220.1 CAAX protease [Novosphingobium guangzhouense]
MATRIETPSPARSPVLRELAHFLARPRVLQPVGLRTREGWARLAMLAALHVGGLLLVVLPLLGLYQRAMGQPLPDAFDKLPAGWLLPITIMIAPVLEEMIFRGWQTGRPRALWLLACTGLFAVLVAVAKTLQPLVLAGSLLALAIVAVAGWVRLRKREVPGAYLTAYPALFWLAALLFAAVHLMNYPTVSALALPMVLPQLWAGVLLGFTRQRIGLPAAMLQHACANAAAMVLVQLGG